MSYRFCADERARSQLIELHLRVVSDIGWEEGKDVGVAAAPVGSSFTRPKTLAERSFEGVATKQLCAIKAEGSQVCLTGDRLVALLSRSF